MQVVSWTLGSLMPSALSTRPSSTGLFGLVGYETADAARRLFDDYPDNLMQVRVVIFRRQDYDVDIQILNQKSTRSNMNIQQLTLLNHATELLSSQIPQQAHRIPMALPTSIAATIAKISPATLNRAKSTGRLPYKCSSEGWNIEVCYAHHHAGKDYWKVSFFHVE